MHRFKEIAKMLYGINLKAKDDAVRVQALDRVADYFRVVGARPKIEEDAERELFQALRALEAVSF